MSDYFQCNEWGFSSACKFNCSQIHSSYARLFSWCVSNVLDDSLHVALTTNTSHNNGIVPSIILGNTRVYEDLDTGCPALEYNKDYLIKVHFTLVLGMELDLATDVAGSNIVFSYKAGLGNHNVVPYTTAPRDTFYINATQSEGHQNMTGSIADISISNKLITWNEAFNYLKEKSILNSDIVKVGGISTSELYAPLTFYHCAGVVYYSSGMVLATRIHYQYNFSVSIVSLGTIDFIFEEHYPDGTNYFVNLIGMVTSSQSKPAVVHYDYSSSTSGNIRVEIRTTNDQDNERSFMFPVL